MPLLRCCSAATALSPRYADGIAGSCVPVIVLDAVFSEPNRFGPAIASGWLAGGAFFLAIRRRNLCNSRVSGSDLAADAAKIRWERDAIAISLRRCGGDCHVRMAGLLLGIAAFRDPHADCSHEMAAHDRGLGEIFRYDDAWIGGEQLPKCLGDASTSGSNHFTNRNAISNGTSGIQSRRPFKMQRLAGARSLCLQEGELTNIFKKIGFSVRRCAPRPLLPLGR